MQILHTLAAQLPDLDQLVMLAVWLLILCALFIPLERFWSLRPAHILRPDIVHDLCYYAINSLLPKFLLILPISAAAWLAHAYVPYRILAFSADLSFWPRFLLASLVAETGFYWGHRWSHEIPFLWRFHAVHHSAEHIDFMVNVRAHPIDMVFTRLCGFVPLYVLGLSQQNANHIDAVPFLIVLMGTVWGFFIHANLRWRLGWFEHILATPAFHHWHHTNDHRRDMNYASTLPFLDRLFGTYNMPKHEWPEIYGIDAQIAPGLIGQLMDPLMLDPPKHKKQASKAGLRPDPPGAEPLDLVHFE